MSTNTKATPIKATSSAQETRQLLLTRVFTSLQEEILRGSADIYSVVSDAKNNDIIIYIKNAKYSPEVGIEDLDGKNEEEKIKAY